MWYTCVQCGKKFELSEAEKDFYEEKNLSLPDKQRSVTYLSKPD